MNKRLLILTGIFVLAVVVIVGFILFVKSRNETISSSGNQNQNQGASQTNNKNNKNNNNQGTNSQNQGQTGQVVRISDAKVVSPAFSYDQQAVWYFTADGHLYKQNVESGVKQEFVLPNNYQVANVIWPLAGNDFIVAGKSGPSMSFNYYNSETKSFFAYPQNVRGVDFLPDGKHVLYEWDDAKGKASLSMANFDLGGHKTIADLPDAGMVVKVSPLGNKALLYKSYPQTDGKIYYVTLDTYKIYPIRTAADNEVAWSPDGQKFIFNKLGSDNDTKNSSLWLGDIISGADKNMNISTAFNKVAFGSNGQFVYAAIPGANASDTIWKINASTLDKQQIYTPQANTTLNATNLLVRNDGKYLLFIGSDGFLYSLGL